VNIYEVLLLHLQLGPLEQGVDQLLTALPLPRTPNQEGVVLLDGQLSVFGDRFQLELLLYLVEVGLAVDAEGLERFDQLLSRELFQLLEHVGLHDHEQFVLCVHVSVQTGHFYFLVQTQTLDFSLEPTLGSYQHQGHGHCSGSLHQRGRL